MRFIQSHKSPISTIIDQQQTTIYNQDGQIWDPNKEPRVVESTSQSGGKGRKEKVFFWASILCAVLTIAIWILSLVVGVLHFKYYFSTKKDHPAYIEVAKAISDPSSIAKNLPQPCLSWLQANAPIVATDLLNIGWQQILQTVMVAFQIIVSSGLIGFFLLGHKTLRVNSNNVLSTLTLSATVTFLAIAIPAMATGFWILGSVTLGNQDEFFHYTDNFNTTGGCTFAAVNMNRQWGYWDVETQRGFRVAMSLLGVA